MQTKQLKYCAKLGLPCRKVLNLVTALPASSYPVWEPPGHLRVKHTKLGLHTVKHFSHWKSHRRDAKAVLWHTNLWQAAFFYSKIAIVHVSMMNEFSGTRGKLSRQWADHSTVPDNFLFMAFMVTNRDYYTRLNLTRISNIIVFQKGDKLMLYNYRKAEAD